MTRRMRTALIQLIQLHSNNCRGELDREAFKEDYRRLVTNGRRSMGSLLFYGLVDRAELFFWLVTTGLFLNSLQQSSLMPVELFSSFDLGLLVTAGIVLIFWGRMYRPSQALLAEASEVLREVRAELSKNRSSNQS